MLFSLLLIAFASVTAAFNELLPPHKTVCYWENLRKDDQFSVSFQVGTRDPNSSEQPDVDFWIESPTGERLVDLIRVPDAQPSVKVAVTGRHQFCFSNLKSGEATKDVTFHVNNIWASELRSERLNTLDGQIKLLDRLIREIDDQKSYLVLRERVHRNTAESTNDRVKWWNIFQLLVVGANAVFQVYYLKRFFEIKSNV